MLDIPQSDAASTAKAPPSWPLVAFAGNVAFLVVPIAIGSASARVGAVGAAVGILLAFGVAVSITRREHADDVNPPSLFDLARESAASTNRFWLYMGGYIVLIFLVGFAPGGGPRRESGAAGLAVAAASALLVLLAMWDAFRHKLRQDGVERDVLYRAATIAFFVTMATAVSYGLLEVFAPVRLVSMWVVWTVGMFPWALATSVLTWRAR